MSNSIDYFRKMFLELPRQVITTVLVLFKLLPVHEWTAFMYTCRALNLELCERFFGRTGVIFHASDVEDSESANSEDGLDRCELEFSSSVAIAALNHWRRSALFQAVNAMFFVVSGRSPAFSSQVHLIADFLSSLPAGGRHFEEITIYVDESYDNTPLDTSLALTLIASALRAGVSKFSFDSASDTQFHMLSRANLCFRQTENTIFPHLKSFSIRSSILLIPVLQEWVLELLSESHGLSALDFCVPRPESTSLSPFVSRIRAPTIKFASLGGVDEAALASFLTYHAMLFSLELYDMLLDVCVPPGTVPAICAPNLKLISGEARNIKRIVGFLDETSVQDVVVKIQLDEAGIAQADFVQPLVFDVASHRALLQELAVREVSMSLLIITFPSLHRFVGSFFDVGQNPRTETRLNVAAIHVILACTDGGAVGPLLVSP